MFRFTIHHVWSIEYYIRVRTLRWVGHVARMDKNAAATSAPRGMGSEFWPIGDQRLPTAAP